MDSAFAQLVLIWEMSLLLLASHVLLYLSLVRWDRPNVIFVHSASNCEKCFVGKFIENANSSQDGKYFPFRTYSDSMGSSFCSLCASGKSNEMHGAASPHYCLLCGRGKYFALTTNGSKCEMFPPGMFIDRLGVTSVGDCLDCSLEAPRSKKANFWRVVSVGWLSTMFIAS